ncbi:DegV family protein [Anaerofustis stercorihominis]|uniref:DegV family protein n=1 Tax=Anaerofustis stercorihominis TaxID=214853 RepID=A0A3E3DU95_9FIRM|nr:DegV family protein [Anaerofustis stercorihominis]RGD72857.1 DegV family protein [Anaerofustis stercorihominis]
MSDYMITCCSTADMSEEFFKVNDIPLAYFHYILDGKTYADDLGKSIPFDKFYDMIAEGASPTTSQISPEEYVELFEPILKSGKDVLHITLSSGISGTINSANIAKDMMNKEYPERKVIVIDSLGASSGYGLLVTLAKEKQKEGLDIDELAKWVEENRLNVHHWFFSTDLTSYFRGGRISRTSAIFGTALKICPLLNMSFDGKLIPRSKYRGKKRVIEEIVKRMEEHAVGGLDYSGKCYISHSNCIDDAKSVAEKIESKFPGLDGRVIINSVGTTIGSHTGPGTVALFFVGDKRED